MIVYFIVVFYRCKTGNVIFVIEMLLIKFIIFQFKFRLFLVFLRFFSDFLLRTCSKNPEKLILYQIFFAWVIDLLSLICFKKNEKPRRKCKSKMFQTKKVPEQNASQTKCVLGQIVSWADCSLRQVYSEVVVFQTRFLPKLAVFWVNKSFKKINNFSNIK